MRTLAISEFKAKCLSVVDEVARTGDPVLLTKRGRAIARVVPAADEYPQRSLVGTVETLADVVSPVLPPDAWDAVRGEWEPARPRARPRQGPRRKRSR